MRYDFRFQARKIIEHHEANKDFKVLVIDGVNVHADSLSRIIGSGATNYNYIGWKEMVCQPAPTTPPAPTSTSTRKVSTRVEATEEDRAATLMKSLGIDSLFFADIEMPLIANGLYTAEDLIEYLTVHVCM